MILRYKRVRNKAATTNIDIIETVNNVIQNPSNKDEMLIAGYSEWFKVIHGYNVITSKHYVFLKSLL